MNRRLKQVAEKCIAAVLAVLILFSVFSVESYAAESTGVNKFDKFIRDSRYKDGAAWESGKHPELSASGSSGCASYCADFVKYCYGIDALTSKDVYTKPSAIRAGDVIHLKSANSGHWVVILKREGKKLYTAEGNWNDRVRVGWNYEISDGDVTGSRHSFDCGYHFLPKAGKATWVKTSDGGWKYRYKKGVYARNAWLKDKGKWYYFNAKGLMVTGWKMIKKKWYYFNAKGAMVTGWKMIKKKWYYFNTKGAMVTGRKKIGKTVYTFDKNGVLVDQE
jgi:hypothetical protein